MGDVGAVSGPDPTALPERGKVNKVRQQFAVHEDGALAHKLQNEEFDAKYGLNRFNRRTVREDIPVAKVVQSEEEERLQKERYEFLERQKALATRDEKMARQLQEEDLQKKQALELDADRDAQVARQMMEREQYQRRQMPPESEEDAIIARQMQEELHITEEQQRLKDEQMARELQIKEKEKYERRKLAKDRKKLEKQVQQEARDFHLERGNAVQIAGATSESQNDKLVRYDGKVEDLGDFSDFYIPPDPTMDGTEKKELQELQDEELARLLQDQEHKRGAKIPNQKIKSIEQQDAELARIMQEEEKLKLKKHKRHKHEKQLAHSQGSRLHEEHDYDDKQWRARESDEYHIDNFQNNHLHSQRNNSVGNGKNSVTVRQLSQDRDFIPRRQEDPLPPHPSTPPHAVTAHYGRHRSELGDGGSVGSMNKQLSSSRSPQQPSRDFNGRQQSFEQNTPSSPSPPAYHGSHAIANNESKILASSSQQNVSTVHVGGPSSNLFSAIDPTFRQGKGEIDIPPQVLNPGSLSIGGDSQNTRMPPTDVVIDEPRVSAGHEDGYLELEDENAFAPVPGQRRTLNKKERGSKKQGSCKQQ